MNNRITNKEEAYKFLLKYADEHGYFPKVKGMILSKGFPFSINMYKKWFVSTKKFKELVPATYGNMFGNAGLSFKYVQKFIKDEGDELISDVYLNGKTLMQIKCKDCKNIYDQTFTRYQLGHRHICENSHLGHIKYTYDSVKSEIEKEGHILVSTKYVNSKTKLDILCGICGNEYKRTFNSYNTGYRHSKCPAKPKKIIKYTHDQVNEFMLSHKDTLISPIYSTLDSELEIQCGVCGRNHFMSFLKYKRHQKYRLCQYHKYERTRSYEMRVCRMCPTEFETLKSIPKAMCSPECVKLELEERRSNGFFKTIGSLGGKVTASRGYKRSKNETYMFNLCQKYFGKHDVLSNAKIFEGWDADIVIESLKIAIRWNGIWHYKKVRDNHNLEDVQRRDKLKEEAIERCGYEVYAIKDMGKHNLSFVGKEFDIFIDHINRG